MTIQEMKRELKALIAKREEFDLEIANLEDAIEREGEELPTLYYALIKGHELSSQDEIYWNYNRDLGLYVEDSYYYEDTTTFMTIEEWNKLGINESNAEFKEVRK